MRLYRFLKENENNEWLKDMIDQAYDWEIEFQERIKRSSVKDKREKTKECKEYQKFLLGLKNEYKENGGITEGGLNGLLKIVWYQEHIDSGDFSDVENGDDIKKYYKGLEKD